MGLVEPKPPTVHDELPHIGAGLRFAQAPTKFFTDLRAQYGDTFLVDVFGYSLFCTFSPKGLESLYSLPEEQASFGMATFDLMGFKTPLEIFMDADIDLFYDLLKPIRVRNYVNDFNTVANEVLEAWGNEGELDVFDCIRTLEQRIGFQVWMGRDAAKEGSWQRLKAQFDVLSQENAFVNPQATLDTLTSNKSKERAALAQLRIEIDQLVLEREQSDTWPDDTLSFLYQRFQSEEQEVTRRKLTHNLVNANQGFLSNLYAAIAWVLINCSRYPQYSTRMREELATTEKRFGAGFLCNTEALDSMRFFEQMLMESTRMAQRSITLRKVMQETTLDCGDQQYSVQPGVYITTMLSVTNTDSDELSRFDPDHYDGRRLKPELVEGGKEQVSTFGHGRHACPAQKFSHYMCKVVLGALLQKYEFGAPHGDLEPSVMQMGGVSRTDAPTLLSYRQRA